MEKRVDFTLVPSLTRSIMTKIAITLWHQDDIMDLVSDFFLPFSENFIFIDRRKIWQEELESKVMKRILKLQLPEILRKNLSYFVGAVGWQIMIWKDYYQNNLHMCSFRENWKEICWTSHGTIDMKKTAEILVKNGNLSIEKRYELACTYCLEDDIYALWRLLSNKQFHGKDLEKIRMHESPLISFWSHLVEGKTAELSNTLRTLYRYYTPNEYAFQCSVHSDNVAGVRYFLQKLTPEEKRLFLVQTVKFVASRHKTHTLCFLLSTMDKEEQMEVFNTCLFPVLHCLLDWPWQDFFMETANSMWASLREIDYYELLVTIVRVATQRCKDYNYQKLFEEFWQRGSDGYKRYVIGRCALDGTLLASFFESKSKEMISLISLVLKDANHVEKEKIFHLKGKDICRKLIDKKEWDLLKFFIGECGTSVKELIKLKGLFKHPAMLQYSKEDFLLMKHDQHKFFKILNGFIRRCNKRESAKDLPSKKFSDVESVGQNSDKSINSGQN